MLDIGITKLAIIGGLALLVIGPERLPSVARMVGTLVGRAQRYVAEVKEEVNRSMELDELKKMKDTVEEAAREVNQTLQTSASDFKSAVSVDDAATSELADKHIQTDVSYDPVYKPPQKRWRLRRGAVPHWYKVRHGVRTSAQSGAARVARYRPKS